MRHPRSDIRKAIITILKSAATRASNRIYDTPVLPLPEAQAQLIIVFYNSEIVSREDNAVQVVGFRQRSIALTVKAGFMLSPDEAFSAGEVYDDFAEEIEIAIDANPTLRSTAETVWFEGTNFQVAE